MSQEHIFKQFDADLEEVRSRVLQMGGMVEEQITKSIEALTSGNLELADEVIAHDHNANALEVQIDEDVAHVIARRAPTASDLRLIVAVIKTITDLERIGDETEKLGHAAARLSKSDRTADRYRELKHIGELVADMVHGALDAFARLDTEAALSVARRDRVIDEEYEVLQRQCITFMMEDPRAIRRTLDILSLARALERVGDHAKNICEYVVYMVLGKDIRHLSIEDVERQVVAARASRQAEGG